MNVHQSAIPVLIVAAPLITAFVLPVLGWWKRAAVFPLTLAALVFTFGAAIAAAREVLANGPVQYFMGGWAPPWGIEYRIDHLGQTSGATGGLVPFRWPPHPARHRKCCCCNHNHCVHLRF